RRNRGRGHHRAHHRSVGASRCQDSPFGIVDCLDAPAHGVGDRLRLHPPVAETSRRNCSAGCPSAAKLGVCPSQRTSHHRSFSSFSNRGRGEIMRDALSVIKNDFSKLRRSVMASCLVLFLILIPLLFTWFNVLAAWDPFGNTKDLKIAVASEDE